MFNIMLKCTINFKRDINMSLNTLMTTSNITLQINTFCSQIFNYKLNIWCYENHIEKLEYKKRQKIHIYFNLLKRNKKIILISSVCDEICLLKSWKHRMVFCQILLNYEKEDVHNYIIFFHYLFFHFYMFNYFKRKNKIIYLGWL